MLLYCGAGEDSSPFNSKIKTVNPKGNQCWRFTGRTVAEAEAPIFWPSDVKNWLTGKDPDAGKDRGQDKRGWDGWVASLTQWTSFSKLWEVVKDREAWSAALDGIAESNDRDWKIQLNRWQTELGGGGFPQESHLEIRPQE